MVTLNCQFLETKTVTSNKDGKEYTVMTVLYRDKFAYRLMDFFVPKGMKIPKYLEEITLEGYWSKKDDKWQFHVLGGK